MRTSVGYEKNIGCGTNVRCEKRVYEQILDSSITTMRDLGCSVRESTLHQQVESELISSAAETVAERLHRILEAMHHQGEEHERIALALEVFRETAEGNTERASEVQRTVEALERQHSILDDELNRFQL